MNTYTQNDSIVADLKEKEMKWELDVFELQVIQICVPFLRKPVIEDKISMIAFDIFALLKKSKMKNKAVFICSGSCHSFLKNI